MNSLHNVLFYPRLAVTSMKKNRGIYLPYLMAGGVMAGLLYVLDSVGVMVEASQMAGGSIMQVIVEICGSICTVRECAPSTTWWTSPTTCCNPWGNPCTRSTCGR